MILTVLLRTDPECLYFRKAPSHFVDFCHPGDSSFDEEEAELIRTDKGPRLKRVSLGKCPW